MCKKAAPSLAAGRKKGPAFKVADTQDLELNRMMANMKVGMLAVADGPCCCTNGDAVAASAGGTVHSLLEALTGGKGQAPAISAVPLFSLQSKCLRNGRLARLRALE